MIYVKELSKEFGKVNNKKTVLNKVSWIVMNGSVTGLFGKKKSGKTAALRIITGIQSFSHGQVMIDGRDITIDAVEARKAFGYVPDSKEQFLGLTGEEYLNFIADVYEVEEERREVFKDTYIPKLNLELELYHRMDQYIPSVYKKIMLLGAMIYSPTNLILDNIFEGFDSEEQGIIKQILKEYAGTGKAVLLANDNLSLARDLCGHVIYLANGNVKFDGSLVSLMEKYHETVSLDAIDLMLSGDLGKLSEKEISEPVISRWGE